MSPSQALTSHSSGGSSIRMPTAWSASVRALAGPRAGSSGRGRGGSPARRAPSSRGCRPAGTDARVAQRGARLLERLLELVEGLLFVGGHGRWLPGGRQRVAGQCMTIASNGRPPGGHEACRIRIAAAGDIHCGRARRRPRARGGAFAALQGRVDLVLLAGDLTTHGQPEQAAIVADAVPRPRRARADRARQPRLALQPPRTRSSRCSRRAASPCSSASHRVVECDGARVGVVGPRASSAASPARTSRTSASRCCGESTRRPRTRWRRSTAGLGASRLRVPDRAAALRADRPRRSRASAARSGRSSAPTASPRRSASTAPTSSCTATRTPAVRGPVGEVPVYNVSVPVLGETSGSSSSPGTGGCPQRSTSGGGGGGGGGRGGEGSDERSRTPSA